MKERCQLVQAEAPVAPATTVAVGPLSSKPRLGQPPDQELLGLAWLLVCDGAATDPLSMIQGGLGPPKQRLSCCSPSSPHYPFALLQTEC